MDQAAINGSARTPALSPKYERQAPMTTEHEQLVRERAHLLWEDEGRPEGCAERHWVTAEQSLSNEETAWKSPANAAYEPSYSELGPTDPKGNSSPSGENMRRAPVQIPYPALKAAD
jgi:hypothetical protein